ncbi:MAG: GTPase Era [Candidatus Schekmanbacteria bacterium]|nr:GTPase Era [Candidatus Schekmanbacteria bacterium]
MNQYKSGYISIIVLPNAGKSTLMNQLLGQKLAIVSPRPQTTRNRILGVKTLPEAQCIFIDTPGICRPRNVLDKKMLRTTRESLKEVDLVLWMTAADTILRDKGQLREIAETLKPSPKPIFLLLNKIDLIPDKNQLLPLIDELSKWLNFAEIIPISAFQSENLSLLLEKLPLHLPEGPKYFPDDFVTDQPERFLLAEIIREKLYYHTHQEIPYSCAVALENMQEAEEQNLLRMQAVIYVEQDSQKKIVIGKGGSLIKKVGTQARLEMEQILGCRVFLDLWVKVRKDWRQEESFINLVGY